MPYISPERRQAMNGEHAVPETPGELNYAVSMLLHTYRLSLGTSYQTINDCLGALEGAKLEFYRRVVAPYEDGKILKNGDVYE
jgi:hypothetical protein